MKRGRGSVDIKGLFSRSCDDRTRSNGYRLKQGKSRLDIDSNFFTVRV